MIKKKYWNPFLETLSSDKLVKNQIKRFREAIAFAIKSCPMYREKLKGIRISPADIKTLDDIRRIPITDKEELRRAYACGEPFLYGKTLAADLTELCRLRQTSGRRGDPFMSPTRIRVGNGVQNPMLPYST